MKVSQFPPWRYLNLWSIENQWHISCATNLLEWLFLLGLCAVLDIVLLRTTFQYVSHQHQARPWHPHYQRQKVGGQINDRDHHTWITNSILCHYNASDGYIHCTRIITLYSFFHTGFNRSNCWWIACNICNIHEF